MKPLYIETGWTCNNCKHAFEKDVNGRSAILCDKRQSMNMNLDDEKITGCIETSEETEDMRISKWEILACGDHEAREIPIEYKLDYIPCSLISCVDSAYKQIRKSNVLPKDIMKIFEKKYNIIKDCWWDDPTTKEQDETINYLIDLIGFEEKSSGCFRRK
jgi:hypothetical protein